MNPREVYKADVSLVVSIREPVAFSVFAGVRATASECREAKEQRVVYVYICHIYIHYRRCELDQVLRKRFRQTSSSVRQDFLVRQGVLLDNADFKMVWLEVRAGRVADLSLSSMSAWHDSQKQQVLPRVLPHMTLLQY